MSSNPTLKKEKPYFKKEGFQKQHLNIKNEWPLLKIAGMLLLLSLVNSAAFAQRSCATMDYYQYRLQQDPSLADRMAAEETAIQQWTKDNPVSISSPSIQWPVLAGFTPTGNETTDRQNYSSAKAAYYREHPKQLPSTVLTEQQMKAAREAKSKNKLTVINK